MYFIRTAQKTDGFSVLSHTLGCGVHYETNIGISPYIAFLAAVEL